MPILTTCSCGKALRAPDAFAGRRVRCPACGSALTVPGPTAAARLNASGPSTAASPSPSAKFVHFRCTCGKGLVALTDNAGRIARCPKCGDHVIIPASNGRSESRLPAEPPAPVPPPASPPVPSDSNKAPTEPVPFALELAPHWPDVPADSQALSRPPSPRATAEEIPEAELAPELRRDEPPKAEAAETAPKEPARETDPSRPAPVKTDIRRRVPLRLTLIASILVLLGGSVAAAWWMFFRNSSDNNDMVYIPGNVAGFVSLRAGDMMKLSLGRRLIDQMPPFAKTGMDAVHLDDVERATFVINDLDSDNTDDEVWIVLRMIKPVDKGAIFKAMGGDRKERHYEGRTYYVPAALPGMSVWFAADRVVVAGSEKALKKAMSLPATRRSGLLDTALAALAARHHLVAAFVPPADRMQDLRKAPPPVLKPYRSLLEATLVSLTGDMSDQLALEAKVSFPSEEKASAAKGTMEQGIGAARMALAAFDAGFVKRADRPGSKLDALLDDVKTEQSGSIINLRFMLSGEAVVDGFMVLSSALTRSVPGANPRAPRVPGQPAPVFPPGNIFRPGGRGAT